MVSGALSVVAPTLCDIKTTAGHPSSASESRAALDELECNSPEELGGHTAPSNKGGRGSRKRGGGSPMGWLWDNFVGGAGSPPTHLMAVMFGPRPHFGSLHNRPHPSMALNSPPQSSTTLNNSHHTSTTRCKPLQGGGGWHKALGVGSGGGGGWHERVGGSGRQRRTPWAEVAFWMPPQAGGCPR